MSQYASQQPAGYTNTIKNVALVGASGTIGSNITKALLATGKHTITALTRVGSPNKLPEGVKVQEIEYDNGETIVAALKGQDALVISLSVMSPPETQAKLIQAAAEAGVPWVIPNQWGSDSENGKLEDDVLLGKGYKAARELVEKLGKSSWVDVNCSFWYEFSLGGPKDGYGFDIAKREVMFYDDGTEKINTSTLAQAGRAVAALLSLDVLPIDAHDKRTTLSQFRNKGVRVSSFCISQRDMFESVKRVTGTTDADWTITSVDPRQRYADGMKKLMSGDSKSFVSVLYSRVFFPTGEGNFEATKGLHNLAIGIPVDEDLDEATKLAVEINRKGGSYGEGAHA